MSTRSPRIRPAPALLSDLDGIARLLSEADLPHGDIEPHLKNFLVVRNDAGVTAAVGLEVNGPDALLRSLVVAPAQRGEGLGRALVREIAALARKRGVERLFLLTTTAAAFFEHAGFSRIERSEAPPTIADSRQFQGLCPASAVCLTARVEEVMASCAGDRPGA